LNSEGVVPIKDGEVRYGDVDRVIETAQAMAIPADQRLLHVLPRDYIIDKQDGIKEPLGMAGSRLEAKVHLVTCSENSSQNIHKCINASGLDVEAFVLEQLASSYSVLTHDERDLGVCLIDIGGGTTDMAVFMDGSIAFTDVIPIAGDHVTNDIAQAQPYICFICSACVGGVLSACAISLVTWSPAIGMTSVNAIEPSMKTAMSVVPPPMSIKQTPKSLSSCVKTE
jgi:cell division protein FtsA